jgi:Double-GTPase 1
MSNSSSEKAKTNFNILMIGPSGSGKTVYLAALWKKLNVPARGNLDFYLSLPDQQEKINILNGIYETVAFESEWPPGTANVSSWSFDCRVRKRDGKTVKALTFNYLDYAGGNFGSYSDVDQEVQKAIRNADGYLVLVDGLRLLQLHQGKKQGVKWAVQFGSTVIPPLLQDATKPTQFVISKWDVLQSAGLSLQDCKKLLFEKITQVSEFVRPLVEEAMLKGDRKASIRIYPVSSVGEQFAWYDEANDSMHKCEEVFPEPFNVECPLTSLIPLYIEQQINAEQEELKRAREAEVKLGKRPELDLEGGIRVGMKKGFDGLGQLPFAGALFKWAGEGIGGDAQRQHAERVKSHEASLQTILKQQGEIAEELRAQQHCCDMFLKGMHTFEAMNPECLVTIRDLPS